MLRLTTVMTGLAGAPYYSTLYTAGTEQAHADQAEQALHDFWEDIAGYITTGLSIQISPEIDVVNPVDGLVTDTRTGDSVAVASAGNAPLPKSTQGLLRLRTSTFVGGRRLIGRTFIPALANDAQLGGVPSSGFLSTLAGAAETMRAALEPGDNDWVIWHRPNPDSQVPAGSTGAVTSVSAWTQFAVLRSRRD